MRGLEVIGAPGTPLPGTPLLFWTQNMCTSRSMYILKQQAVSVHCGSMIAIVAGLAWVSVIVVPGTQAFQNRTLRTAPQR